VTIFEIRDAMRSAMIRWLVYKRIEDREEYDALEQQLNARADLPEKSGFT